jgi:signal transduction histidine kinase
MPADASETSLVRRLRAELATLRAQAAHQQTLLEAAEDGILGLDRDGRVTFANAAARRLFGGLPTVNLLGRPIRTLIPGLGTDDDVCWRDDGTSFTVEYEHVPLYEDGEAVGAVLTCRDASARHAVDRAKDEVIGTVSHELRSPLTAVRAALGLLASGQVGQLPEAGRRMVEIATTNTDRLLRLIQDLLDLERLNAGQTVLHCALCDVSGLMHQAADGLRASADEVGVHVEVLASQARVWGDADRLIQVLTNLLANAIRFSSRGGTVWLDAERGPTEVVFRVRDQGRGIPVAQLATIFDPFVMLDAAEARDKRGTGLGLAICRSIVAQHGGNIWAESSPGIGTTLFVAIPDPATSVREPAIGEEAA